MALDPDYDRYIEGFDSDASICHEFGIPDLDGYEVLFACYDRGCYDGDAYLLLEKDKKLFVVEASHCSCYGLDGMFDPVETSTVAIRKERCYIGSARWSNKQLFNDILDDFDRRMEDGKS